MMRKVIPFKKEILFKTKINEITSISLEHDYKIEDSCVSGKFIICGDYKITASSINREKFNYDIDFDIALDSRIDTEKMVFDIDNFYYEVINDEILKVNIDVYLEGDYKKEIESQIEKSLEEVKEEAEEVAYLEELIEDINRDKEEVLEGERGVKEEDNSLEEEVEPRQVVEEKVLEFVSEEVNDPEVRGRRTVKTLEEQEPLVIPETEKVVVQATPISKEVVKPEVRMNEEMDIAINVFDNIKAEETYATYYVYIVKEGDSIDSILTKYNITKDELAEYNEIETVTKGDKLIIPCHYE